MQILSNFTKDHVTPGKQPGGYEWWYFDAIDPDSGLAFVIIIYEGNPFSNRYIRALEQGRDVEAAPDNFPAVSISIYRKANPVFYSFTEFEPNHAQFDPKLPELKIGDHSLEFVQSEKGILYRLNLNETLANGEQIQAELDFRSPKGALSNFLEDKQANSKGHAWNLVQPRAGVEGKIQLFKDTVLKHDFAFSGTGYHDHNTGQEPMKDEFKDWYWGRFHFRKCTLVYYVMNRKDKTQYRAWLLDKGNESVIHTFQNVDLSDRNLSLFGLNPAHKLLIQNDESRILVQQNQLLDNGPFYQRYLSEGFLYHDDGGLQKTRGISEYICPGRIYWKMFWPLVDMRIRYKKEPPHWVQKSSKLYRWTW